MTDTDRVTAATMPWEEYALRDEPGGTYYRQSQIIGNSPKSWGSKVETIVICDTLNADFRLSEDERQDLMGFVVKAGNACFEINPTNPRAAAAEIGNLATVGREFHEAVEALLDWMNGNDLVSDHADQKPEDYNRLCRALADHSALLSRIHSQSNGGGDG